MMRNLSLSVFMLFGMLVSGSVYAVRVHSIYYAEVPVVSQASQEKARAASIGLAQVLIKVSGNIHVVDNAPTLKAALDHADGLVQEYSYASHVLTMRFDPDAVNRLLKNATVPVWGQNRPLTLVWLVFEGPNHPADIVDSESSLPQTLLKRSAKLRGLPVIFPTMDVADLGQVSVNDVLTKSIPTLQKAAARYASNALLIGHVTQTGTTFTSQWTLSLDADQWTWDIPGNSLEDVMQGVTSNMTDTLAPRYALVMNDTVQSQLTLRVTGITQQTDLVQLMKYLQHLAPVSSVELRTIVGHEIILDVSLRGSKQSLIQALGLGKNIEPVAGATPDEDTLLYKWSQ